MSPPFSLFLSRSCSPFFFLDLLDFFSLTLLELEDVEEDPAGEDTEGCFTLSVRLVAEAEETEEALEVVEAGEPGREVEARLAGRAVAAAADAIEVGGACSAPESIFDSEDESSSGNFRAWKEFNGGKSGSIRNQEFGRGSDKGASHK